MTSPRPTADLRHNRTAGRPGLTDDLVNELAESRKPREPNAAQANQKPSAELHDGVTDIYYVVGGSGTVLVGGEIENRRVSRPGEYLGQMAAGKPFKLQAGDILTIPPNMAHGTVPDAGGMTYVLQKINVGLYPWSLINGTP